MKTFLWVWMGQVVSLIGTGLTSFGLGIWVYQRSQSTAMFAMAALAAALPGILLAPVAGALIDRWDRRWAMLIADTASGLCSAGAAALLLTNRLEVWHVYLFVSASSAMDTLRTPAWLASTSLLVSPDQLGRASGMVQSAQALGQLVSPLLAGVLVASVGVPGVLVVDTGTFVFALLTLVTVRFPRASAAEAKAASSSLRADIAEGWSYVRERAGLWGMMILGFTINFALAMAQVSIAPMLLSFSTPAVLGTVVTVGGVGMLVGSGVMGGWGGPNKRALGFLGFTAGLGVALSLFGLLPPGPWTSVASFNVFFFFPLITGCSQVIWQRKTATGIQGRVFALRNMLAMASAPLAYLLVGPLVDGVLDPAMSPGGALAETAGQLLGVGKGHGGRMLFVLLGAFLIVTALLGLLMPRVRRVEQELPDMLKTEAAGAAVAAAFEGESSSSSVASVAR